LIDDFELGVGAGDCLHWVERRERLATTGGIANPRATL
jgi:hypothetical protein